MTTLEAPPDTSETRAAATWALHRYADQLTENAGRCCNPVVDPGDGDHRLCWLVHEIAASAHAQAAEIQRSGITTDQPAAFYWVPS